MILLYIMRNVGVSLYHYTVFCCFFFLLYKDLFCLIVSLCLFLFNINIICLTIAYIICVSYLFIYFQYMYNICIYTSFSFDVLGNFCAFE